MLAIRSLLVSCAGILALPTADAGVWVVAPELAPGVTHTNLSTAIFAANDGDTILVRPGVYIAPFFDGKGLTIAADGGPVTFSNNARIANLPADRRVVFRGLQQVFAFGSTGFVIENCAGSVVIEDCAFTSTNGTGHGGTNLTPAVVVKNSSNVVFSRCSLAAVDSLLGFGVTAWTISDGPHGLQAIDSHVSAFDCFFRGATSVAFHGQGGHGAVIVGGSLFASGCSFVGNGGGGPWEDFGLPGGNGGDGVRLSSHLAILPNVDTTPAIGRFVDCSFTAGAAGPGSATLPGGLPGLPQQVLLGSTYIALPGPYRGFESTSPIHAGQSTTMTFDAPAGELVFTAASFAADPLHVGALQGTFVPATPFLFTALGTMPASGHLALTIPLPSLPASVGAVQVFHQAVFGVPPGVGRLGSPSTLLLLDPSY